MTIQFLETDTKTILAELKAEFEAASGRVLYPAQVENLLLHVQAYREVLLRQDVQHCAEQNLIGYAIGQHLDELGANKDTPRLQPAAAECWVRFGLDEPDPQGRTIPAGTRLTTADGTIAFETLSPAYVLRNRDTSTEILARCTATGAVGNGLEQGVLCCLDPRQPGVSVTSTSTSEGGGDLETDEAYRERLKLSNARFGGGSAAAYRLQALSASGRVADALAVQGAERGDINIYVLPRDAAETEDPRRLCDMVAEYCNQDTVRMIGDMVFAVPAVPKDYEIEAEVTVLAGQDVDIVMDRVTALAHAYAKAHSAKLGADVTPTQVLLALAPVGEGLYQVNLVKPEGIVRVDAHEWANATSITVTFAGLADE